MHHCNDIDIYNAYSQPLVQYIAEMLNYTTFVLVNLNGYFGLIEIYEDVSSNPC